MKKVTGLIIALISMLAALGTLLFGSSGAQYFEGVKARVATLDVGVTNTNTNKKVVKKTSHHKGGKKSKKGSSSTTPPPK